MLETVLTIIGVGVAVIGLLAKYNSHISKGVDELRECIIELRERITKVETKTELFWKGIEGNIASLLKSPHHPRKDKLLDKLSCENLNQKEASELRDILVEEFDKRKKNSNHLGVAYTLAIARLDLVLFELKEDEKE